MFVSVHSLSVDYSVNSGVCFVADFNLFLAKCYQYLFVCSLCEWLFQLCLRYSTFYCTVLILTLCICCFRIFYILFCVIVHFFGI